MTFVTFIIIYLIVKIMLNQLLAVPVFTVHPTKLGESCQVFVGTEKILWVKKNLFPLLSNQIYGLLLVMHISDILKKCKSQWT